MFISDYIQIITKDGDYLSKPHSVYLLGHSMSCAVLLAVADKLENIGGAILVNPPYIRKPAKGMSPSLWQYFKYAWYMLVAKHTPVVNMAGNPSLIEDDEERKESQQRLNDPLLVKYFSMHYMNETRKLLRAMPEYAKKANYPLLLIYGMKDNIVDKKGCDLIFSAWKHTNKFYKTIANGTHGNSTLRQAADIIQRWINQGLTN